MTEKKTVTVNFVLPDKKKVTIEANEGETILQVTQFHNLPLEGACGGSLACATCHVIIDEKSFQNMQISEDEDDMLDLAFGLQKTSRLGCQVVLTKKLDGITIYIPESNINFDSDLCKCCRDNKCCGDNK